MTTKCRCPSDTHPKAAAFTVMENIFNSNVLDQMIAEGQTEIPEFPVRAITLKPVVLPEVFGDELQVV